MTTGQIGPWVLLVLGAFLLVIVGLRYWKVGGKETGFGAVSVLLIGGLLAGTGTFGLDFMDKYTEFVKAYNTLLSMQSNPSQETYSAAFDAVATGEISGPYRAAVLSLAIENPVSGTDSLLAVSAKRAPSGENKTMLRDAEETLKKKEESAEILAEGLASAGKLTPTAVSRFDPTTRFYVSERLMRVPRDPLPGPAIPLDSIRAAIRLAERRPIRQP